ncbi:MAG TPA: SH3 domain-containing C40 family peptidase [Chthonomonas sp.]|uniref:C40 family peptidase n=1 Tax=Chthonomonas sp. TaxID=2282153 RepID=UPI002B4B91E0|nr:SH3 domain-containing C40 family peptidase [Chthonomonas sp.]HLH81015.1 SH3 domain-containing C40 family peptidase [Chthonomonas sp.]
MPAAVSATALFGSLAAHPALALHREPLQHNETLTAFAHRHHCTLHDLLALNHIKDMRHVPDGAMLLVPPPEKRVHLAGQFHAPRLIHGDQICVRLGPGRSYLRTALLDNDAPVVVTAKRSGWAQIAFHNGAWGWVEARYLRVPTNIQMAHLHRHEARTLQLARRHREEIAREAKRHRAHPAERLARVHSKHLSHLAERHMHHHTQQIAYHKVSHRRHHERHSAIGSDHTLLAHASLRSGLVRSALAYRGTPYVYGGSGRDGFDCSGFVRYLYLKRGIDLPHNAAEQFHMGKPVSRKDLKPGDLVFFHTVTPGISHVGMYIGNGRFIHASSRRGGGGVRIDSLDESYYAHAYRGARRIIRHHGG